MVRSCFTCTVESVSTESIVTGAIVPSFCVGTVCISLTLMLIRRTFVNILNACGNLVSEISLWTAFNIISNQIYYDLLVTSGEKPTRAVKSISFISTSAGTIVRTFVILTGGVIMAVILVSFTFIHILKKMPNTNIHIFILLWLTTTNSIDKYWINRGTKITYRQTIVLFITMEGTFKNVPNLDPPIRNKLPMPCRGDNQVIYDIEWLLFMLI